MAADDYPMRRGKECVFDCHAGNTAVELQLMKFVY